MLVCMLALGIMASGVNPSAGVIFGYTTFFAGFYLSRAKAIVALLLVCAGLFFSAYIYDLWVAYYIFPSLIPSISLSFLGLYVQSINQQEYREAKNTAEKQQLIQIAERERIARDLHDTLGHTLSSIALKSQLAKKLGDKGQLNQALNEIDQVANIASEALSEVRQVITGYRTKGLPYQLDNLQEKLIAAGFDVNIANKAASTDTKIEAAVILMITECVTNIVRHSSGNKVNISLTSTKKSLSVVVQDNGQPQGSIQKGYGLTGMSERVQALGGTMKIITTDGFTIHTNLPVSPHD
ncbi:sensor histidine kinase [Gilvimarinus sp. 2_MG-2023]|uniref:sensor histidine kinase n=1 Tax=Gilvimarinus sp. 2_MG-2023 TaxID=3062666 RepID=UPI0026E2498D|nr:sensor histidine kinase [Gilvimarinus sp. 2_MG-2023]MDO6571006.1 sensor histidine kinase [Gilvimarinus sp. 2_MG-2023]